MIYLYTAYLRHESVLRQQELDECIINNIRNDYFHKVIIFSDNNALVHLLHLLNKNEQKKITVIYNSTTPTYKQWIESIIDEDHIAVFSNADIYFDSSIFNVYNYLNIEYHNRFLCISRYERHRHYLHNNPHWSQDVWAIRQRDKKNIAFIQDLDIPTGVYRCDNKVAYQFAVHGWSLYNPCYYIKCYHHHQSDIRSYNRDESPIFGGLAFVYPCILDHPSSLEYSICIDQNNYNNILGCKTHLVRYIANKSNSSTST